MLQEYNSALVLKSHPGQLQTLLLHHGIINFSQVAGLALFCWYERWCCTHRMAWDRKGLIFSAADIFVRRCTATFQLTCATRWCYVEQLCVTFRQCVFKCVTAGKHGHSALGCKAAYAHELMLGSAFTSKSLHGNENSIFRKDKRERWIRHHLYLCLYVDRPEFYNMVYCPPLVSTTIVSQCSGVEWTWQHFVSWTLPQYTKAEAPSANASSLNNKPRF